MDAVASIRGGERPTARPTATLAGAVDEGRDRLPQTSVRGPGRRVQPSRGTPPGLMRAQDTLAVVSSTTRISTRIAAIAESATLKVDAKAKALQAQGRPVVSYAAGEPDFRTPEHIVEAASAAVLDPRNYRYTPAAGLPDLREAIAEKTARDSGWAIDASQVVVTNGGKQAVYQAFQTLLDDGDEVLVPTPYWTTYPEAIKLAGGVQVDVFAGTGQGYLVTIEQLEAARTERTKVLLFVSPSNPTGAVYSAEQTREIGEWAEAHGLWVIADEIYQNLVYATGDQDDASPLERATSIVEAVPALRDRTILVNGVAKTYAMTGWRVGWMVGPADAIKGAANLQSHLSSNVSNISQRAAIAALTGPQEPAEEMRLAFDRRRRTIVTELNAIDGIKCPTPGGAFYVYPDVNGLLNRDWNGTTPRTSLELADLILEQAEVATVPGEAFGPSGYLRLSYALGDDALLEGVRRLQGLFG
ncbi:aspartate aminotransferase [Rathayibacter rathayi]|uniref:Aminotransferase n=1 Tax=Rathayibacter rathayi TaxID=33887 RepID=A0ABX5AB63_RATRA|nr:aspartate aminotransferase [Rathayibacter rathayi]PPH76443.1 aspartate aminotransferase [Rathayibacter rathayi]